MRSFRTVAAWALVFAMVLAGRSSVAGPRAVELPVPEPSLRVDPLPLPLARPPLDLARLALAPVPDRPVNPGPAPLPRFRSAVKKPFPPEADPGSANCGFVSRLVERETSLARCGISRALGGDVKGARSALEQSLAEEVGAPSALTLFWAAEVDVREGQYGKAEQRHRAALARGLAPHLAAHARLALAWIALTDGNLPKAQEETGHAASLPPPQGAGPHGRFLDGVVRLLTGQAAEALARFEDVERSGVPPDIGLELTFWRGVALRRRGTPDEAIQRLDEFIGAAPPNHPLYRDAFAQHGWAQLEKRAAELAVGDFMTAELGGPRRDVAAQVNDGLARAYLDLRRYEEARDRAARLIGEDPDRALRVLQQVAEEARRGGATQAAEKAYRQLRDRTSDPGLKDYATYRLGESLERLAEQSTEPPLLIGRAQDEYRRLRNEGRDEGLAQRAVYRLALLALRDDPVAALKEGEELLRAGVIADLRGGVLLLTAEAAARAADPNRAVGLFRLALSENPEAAYAPNIRLALGSALQKEGEAEMALEEWERAARFGDPLVRAAAHAAIAEVAANRGHDAQAVRALRALEGLVPLPERELVVLNRGILLVRAGDYAAAIDELRPLLDQTASVDRQVSICRALGFALFRRGQYPEAEEMFLDAVRRGRGEASDRRDAGVAALRANHLDDAERLLGQARLAAEPRVALEAAYALVFARKDEPAELEKRVEGFVGAYPAHPMSGTLLAKLVADALARGRSDLAYGWVKRLLAVQPESDRAQETLVWLAEAEYGQAAVAREAYGEVVARARDRDAVLKARAGLVKAAMDLGRPAEAQQALDAFLKAAPPEDPRVPQAYRDLIRTYEVQGRRDRILATTEAFIARFPDSPMTPAMQLKRGELLLQQRQWDAARAALEAARDKGDLAVASWAHVWLGELHSARKNHDAAIENYLSATYLYPDSPAAALALKGVAQSYLSRKMTRDGRVALEKLVARPGLDPQLARWAREELARLGPATAGEASPSRSGGMTR